MKRSEFARSTLADAAAVGAASHFAVRNPLGAPHAAGPAAGGRPVGARAEDLHEPDFLLVGNRQGDPGVRSAIVLESVLLHHRADDANGLASGLGPHQAVGDERRGPVIAVGAHDTLGAGQARRAWR